MRIVTALSIIMTLPLMLVGQEPLAGFTTTATAAERALETHLGNTIDTASARRMMHIFAARPHVAGTVAQARTADEAIRLLAGWGLDTSRVNFKVYIPFQDSAAVEVIDGGSRTRLDITEPAIASDPTTQLPRWPSMNGYSGVGDVTAPVVYVNYGLPTDYDQLAQLGVSVKGRIVIARYGRSFRGIKSREAEKHGAAGLILYSDPADDGYDAGEIYPAGPMRNSNGVQRGSLFNDQGDPSTPSWPSTPGARRLDESEMNVPRIPVIPIGYGNAEKFLARMAGPSVPNPWQGGLGFRYHVGDGALKARLAVWPERGSRAYKEITDIFGVIPGSTRPDELVIIGGHRDAWGPGALDNVSGTISVLEAARAWGAAARAGMRPERTLVFASWDAEEWGLFGSTEWVQLMADTLDAKAVAYINQDVVASGPNFGAGGSASLQQLMRDVTSIVPQPYDTTMVYDAWAGRARSSSDGKPTLGDLGGGSDFTPFYNHLGIPSLEFGFGGRNGVYHSAYDTWTFVEKFADPGYQEHAAAARIAAVLMARLANAEVVPFEYGDLGNYLAALVDRTREEAGADSISSALDNLKSASGLLAALGQRFSTARNASLSAGHPFDSYRATNAQLRLVERVLTDPDGLQGRPFMRNLVFASDRDNGYANVQLPAVVEGLRDHDYLRAAAAAQQLADRIRTASGILEKARSELP